MILDYNRREVKQNEVTSEDIHVKTANKAVGCNRCPGSGERLHAKPANIADTVGVDRKAGKEGGLSTWYLILTYGTITEPPINVSNTSSTERGEYK